MCKSVFISFTFVYFLFYNVQAQNDIEELQKKYLSYILECAIQNPVTPGDLEDLRRQKMPDKENVKCLFACAYKKAGMMNDKGELFIEGVQEISKKYLASYPEKLKKSEEFTQICKSVNDVTVNDGNKGCERAALIFDCSIKNTPEALTEAEMKADFIKIVLKCAQENPVDMNELMALQQLVIPKKKETKCLLACAYKTEGLMTSKGLYDIKHAYEIAELTKNGDEKRVENGKKMADVCVKVNDIAVTDGEQGCDRAALILKCTIENAPKFGFKIM